MAKRNTSNRNEGQTTGGAPRTTSDSGSAEDRVIALAEELGRIVGTMRAKADLIDREALMQQISQVRDGATHLLEQIGGGGGHQKPSAETTAAAGRQNNQQATRGRSGGVVDAPGKKHRKPVPNEVRVNAADTGRLAKMKIVNASRRRGR